ncbi:Secreted protein containing DUF1080 [Planctomycetales bacterium 10988]|nr:Secreted protein containing DUF1080 [Planctomycetales bacterium 10988]
MILKSPLFLLLITLLALPQALQAEKPQTQSLFNGKDLGNWDYDQEYWRVENGLIIGQTTADNPLDQNTFLIWKEGEPTDFELKVKFRVYGEEEWANSGIQYRSQRMPEKGEYVVGGYQADIDYTKKYLGILYEEKGRGILVLPGDKAVLEPNPLAETKTLPKPRQYKRVNLEPYPQAVEFVSQFQPKEWNTYRIIAWKNRLLHLINDQPVMECLDLDKKNRSHQGVIALQLHRGTPMTIEFESVELTPLTKKPTAFTIPQPSSN